MRLRLEQRELEHSVQTIVEMSKEDVKMFAFSRQRRRKAERAIGKAVVARLRGQV